LEELEKPFERGPGKLLAAREELRNQENELRKSVNTAAQRQWEISTKCGPRNVTQRLIKEARGQWEFIKRIRRENIDKWD
jgi:hypothetical protein